MKNGFRQSMAWLHTWAGLVLGWVLAGFDLTILALGIVFALSALKLRAKLAGSRVRETFLFANP